MFEKLPEDGIYISSSSNFESHDYSEGGTSPPPNNPSNELTVFGGRIKKMESYESKKHQKYFTDMIKLSADKDKDHRIEAMLMVIANALSTIADVMENRL